MAKQSKHTYFKKRITGAWKKEWPKLVLTLLVLTLLGGLTLFGITNYLAYLLKPQTNIGIDCEISKNANGEDSLELFFANEADFAGKQLYVYIWGITSSHWGTDYSVYEHCDRIQEEKVDFEKRFKFFCEFIPPASAWGIKIDAMLSEEILRTKKIKVEWWGETTPYEKIDVYCS